MANGKPVSRPKWFFNEAKWNDANDETRKWWIANPKHPETQWDSNDENKGEYNADAGTDTTDNDGVDTDDSDSADVPVTPDTSGIETAIGEKIDDAMRTRLRGGVAQFKASRQTTINVAELDIKRIWGDKAEALPHSKSKYDPDAPKGDNAPPFNIYYVTKTSKKKGVHQVPRYHLDNAYDRYIGQSLVAAIEANKAIDKSKRDFNVKTALDDLNADRRKELDYFKDAIDLVKTFAAIEECQHVSAAYHRDNAGKIDTSQYPIRLGRLIERTKGGKTVYDMVDVMSLSVSSFINLDVATARTKEGFDDPLKQLSVIEATPFPSITRAPKKGQGGTGQSAEGNDIVVKNIPQFESALGEMAHAVDDDKFVGNLYDYLNKRDAAGNYVNDDLLMSVEKVERFLDRLVSRPEYKARIKANREASGEKAAA